jgi:hypothetical protein
VDKYHAKLGFSVWQKPFTSDTHQYSIYGLTAQPKVCADVTGTVYGTVTTTGNSIGNRSSSTLAEP